MTKAVAKNKYSGYTKGQMEQREQILQMLEEEIQRFEKHPYKLGSFDTHGIYLGLKIAHLHVKEMKWT
jgi:hypothetical protein